MPESYNGQFPLHTSELCRVFILRFERSRFWQTSKSHLNRGKHERAECAGNGVHHMVRISREDYFDEPGEHNTDDMIEAVKKRLPATGIRYFVVASTRGKTAVKFAEALANHAKMISVSEPQYIKEWGSDWPMMDPAFKKKLEELGVTVLDRAPYVFHSSVLEDSKWSQVTPEVLMRETFYALGQGFKVACMPPIPPRFSARIRRRGWK